MFKWEKYTTLVVEDDDMSFKYLELILEKRTGTKIIWAKSGREAIEICREIDTIDIVLMDLQLPDVDGYNALLEIKAIKPYLPVIIQTANSWNEEKEKCQMGGCDAYITKPINLNILFGQMNRLLKNYKSREQKQESRKF